MTRILPEDSGPAEPWRSSGEARARGGGPRLHSVPGERPRRRRRQRRAGMPRHWSSCRAQASLAQAARCYCYSHCYCGLPWRLRPAGAATAVASLGLNE